VLNRGETLLLLEVHPRDRLLRITKEEAQLSKQETTKMLVRGLAHEIKNPLGGIRGAAQLLARELPEHHVRSAGLSAMVGYPADPEVLRLAKENGLELQAHRAQQVTSVMCQQAEMILVMEQEHKTQLEQLYPQVRGKVFRLGQFGQFDIDDPYRQPREAFDTAYQGIAQGVADWLTRIRQLS
jgi:protein-tyrosine phosphatase